MTKNTWVAAQTCASCYAWWQGTKPPSLTLLVHGKVLATVKQTRDGFILSFKTLVKDEFINSKYTSQKTERGKVSSCFLHLTVCLPSKNCAVCLDDVGFFSRREN